MCLSGRGSRNIGILEWSRVTVKVSITEELHWRCSSVFICKINELEFSFALYPDFSLASVLRRIRPSFSTHLQPVFLHPAAWIFYSDSLVFPYMFDTLFPPSPSLSASVFLFWPSVELLVGGCQAEHSYESVRVERRETIDSPCLRWRRRRGAVAKSISANFSLLNQTFFFFFFHSTMPNWSQHMENIAV